MVFLKVHVSFMKVLLPRGVGLEQEATLFICEIPQLLESIIDSQWVGLATVLCTFMYLKLLSPDLVATL